MVQYRRYPCDNPEEIFFLTIVTSNHEDIFFSEEEYRLLYQAWEQPLCVADADLIAHVFNPDHLHILLMPGNTAYSRTVQRFKANVNRILYPSGGTCWQPRFWEHRIRNETDFNHHLDYIHYNPVKHGHVSRPWDWRWSSFQRFVREGYYHEDWADSTDANSLNVAGE